MMLPMERSEVFKILSDIFRQDDIKRQMILRDIVMREATEEPHDIDFRLEHKGSLVGYLRIVNPPEDCVDGEYCFVYYSPLSHKAGNIAIDSFGNIRVYGDYINSFIYRAIKDNANRLADYAKELTRTYQNQLAEKDDFLGCDDVFKVVVDWLQAMSAGLRIKDVTQINYLHHTVCVRNSIGYGADRHYVTEELKVSYASYMKSIQIYLNNTLIITIDDLGLGDTHTCVFINKYNHINCITLNGYLIACLAEALKDRLGMEKLRAYYNSESKYLELVHCGTTFFFNDGMTAYAIDPVFVIGKEKIDKMNDENNKTLKSIVDDVVDKKLKKLVESGSSVYMTKDYLTDQILNQLKIDWHKDAYRSIYSSVWCTLTESRSKIAAYEFEKHFMEYVTLEYYDCFTVRFGLQRIDDNLPGIEIKFYTATQDIYVRMLDHKSSGSGTWSRPLIELKTGSESKVYFDTLKNTNCTYKSFLANVVSKIVLLEGLS